MRLFKKVIGKKLLETNALNVYWVLTLLVLKLEIVGVITATS